jgi:hypothetical protein
MDVDYDRYANFVGAVCDRGALTGFKSHPDYTYMLEHVSVDQGQAYLDTILADTGLSQAEIAAFCARNDAVGDPGRTRYETADGDLIVSPSSLRYILHAHLILSHMVAVGQTEPDVVEVGGGYGGLCLAVHHFARRHGVRIRSYAICDLPNVIRLQRLYLATVDPSLAVDVVDATTYGAGLDRPAMFLVSNYCFSEITSTHQARYREHLFPRVAHGFIAWNNIPVYDIGFPLTVVPEVPLTGGPNNRYVYF